MDFKKIKRGAVITSALSAVIYGAVAGKGIFNKPRFREQHEVLGSYVDTNYPGCVYLPISVHGSGWASAVRSGSRIVTYVYFSKAPTGDYVFTESKVKL